MRTWLSPGKAFMVCVCILSLVYVVCMGPDSAIAGLKYEVLGVSNTICTAVGGACSSLSSAGVNSEYPGNTEVPFTWHHNSSCTVTLSNDYQWGYSSHHGSRIITGEGNFFYGRRYESWPPGNYTVEGSTGTTVGSGSSNSATY